MRYCTVSVGAKQQQQQLVPQEPTARIGIFGGKQV